LTAKDSTDSYKTKLQENSQHSMYCPVTAVKAKEKVCLEHLFSVSSHTAAAAALFMSQTERTYSLQAVG